jgi:transcriptional regulator of acetoin/glycerol metabolism
MKEYIEESYKRSKTKGIMSNNLFSTKILEDLELQNILDKNKELILVATPFINRLYNFVKGSGFFVALCDSEGCILYG